MPRWNAGHPKQCVQKIEGYIWYKINRYGTCYFTNAKNMARDNFPVDIESIIFKVDDEIFWNILPVLKF